MTSKQIRTEKETYSQPLNQAEQLVPVVSEPHGDALLKAQLLACQRHTEAAIRAHIRKRLKVFRAKDALEDGK